ncbi:MAG: DUF882 domain-containing protein, partial [Candidatus Binataceae bacterium]
MGDTKPSTVAGDVTNGVTDGAPSEIERSESSIPAQTIGRRRFIRMTGIAAAAVTIAPASALAMLSAPATPRRLKFYNLHTSERLDVVYFEKGRYIPQALAAIDYILRDYRQNV